MAGIKDKVTGWYNDAKEEYNNWQDDLRGDENNPLSYANILKLRNQFRKSGTKNGGEFNMFDSPTTKYFKILFYFHNGDSESSIGESGGLLSPTWLYNQKDSEMYKYNSAWSYLKMNDEQERAELLVEFVNLLSNINSESPWYFDEISGLETALERKSLTERDFKFEEQRQKISIKCKPDSFDDRIATLLDLYRSITYSWVMKREVIPSNLRKFDMGIYIFSDPVIPIHNAPEKRLNVTLKNNFAELRSESEDISTSYKTSCKYIEFHNCEIDYNSSKTGLTSLKNSEGVSPEYTIDIYFDDCYENRYNEFMGKSFGDLIALDTWMAICEDGTIPYTYFSDSDFEFISEENDDPSKKEGKVSKAWQDLKKTVKDHYKQKQYHDLESRVNYYENSGIDTALNELEGTAGNIGLGIIKKVALGNLYKFSLTKIDSQIKAAKNGHVFSTARAVNEYINDSKQEGKKKYVKKIGNIFNSQTIANNV